MKSLFGAVLLVFSLTFAATAQQNIAKSEIVLHVEIENGNTLDLKAADLSKLPRIEAKAKDHDEKEHTFSGVNLSEVLKLAGAKLDKDQVRGKELGKLLLVEAADGYKAVFAIAELASDFTDRIILLADSRDGQMLPANNGYWQIIVPGEKKHGRWVRQVTALKLKTAE